MIVKRLWYSTTIGTRALLGAWALVGVILAGAAVNHAIDQYRFKRLPAAEQEVIRGEQRRAELERDRKWREGVRLARQNAQNASDREAEQRLQESDRERALEIHKVNVRACIESAIKLLPGLWPSDEAKSKIEADCAEREARSE